MKKKLLNFIKTLCAELHLVRKEAMTSLECPRRSERRFGQFQTTTERDALDLHLTLEPLLIDVLNEAREKLKGFGRGETYGFVVPFLHYEDDEDVEDAFDKVMTYLLNFNIVDPDEGWGWTVEDEWRIKEEEEFN